jgi:hypothetical protein
MTIRATPSRWHPIETALALAERELRHCMDNAHGGKVCFDGDDFHEALTAVTKARASLASLPTGDAGEPVAWTDPHYLRTRQIGGLHAHYQPDAVFTQPLYVASTEGEKL